MARNIEIKAKVNSLDDILSLAKLLSGKDVTVLRQHDIFYNSPNGRLKLRDVTDNDKRKCELIWYNRPDSSGPKLSEYNKFDVSDDMLPALKLSLSSSMGVKGEVKKTRYLIVHEQTRIHVDDVENLGHFMELEVCLTPEQSVEEGEEIARRIQQALKVSDEDLLTGAYVDM